jgi:hypothetical protein
MSGRRATGGSGAIGGKENSICRLVDTNPEPLQSSARGRRTLGRTRYDMMRLRIRRADLPGIF